MTSSDSETDSEPIIIIIIITVLLVIRKMLTYRKIIHGVILWVMVALSPLVNLRDSL